jgi:hypothetical protein
MIGIPGSRDGLVLSSLVNCELEILRADVKFEMIDSEAAHSFSHYF